MNAEIVQFPVLDLPPPASVHDFSLSFLANEDSNSGYFGTAMNDRMIWYHGYRTFLDQRARDIPPDTPHVKAYYDPESVRTTQDKEIIQSRKQEYGRIYTNVINLLNKWMNADGFNPEADFRVECMLNEDCVWVIYLEKRNPVISFVISFDKEMYNAHFEMHSEVARREWYLTFSKESRLTKIYPLIPECLEEMKSDPNSPGMPRYLLMLPASKINMNRIYFVVECYFVNNENINPVDKSFLNTNTANLGFDILNGTAVNNTKAPTQKRTNVKMEEDEMEVDEMEVDEAPKFSGYVPLDKEPPKKKRGKKSPPVSDTQSQITSNYQHLFIQFFSKTGLQLKQEGVPLNFDSMDTEKDDIMRVNDPNFPKKVEFLRTIVDNTVYVLTTNHVCHQLVDEELTKIQNKGTRSEKDMKLFKNTINSVIQLSFQQAQTQKNQKKQEVSVAAPLAWDKFVDEYLAKPTSLFKSSYTCAAIFSDLAKVARRLSKDALYEWCPIQVKDISPKSECLLTKTPITLDNYQKGVKMFISNVPEGFSGLTFFLKDVTMKPLFLILARNMCIWDTVLFPLIRTHINHNFQLFRQMYSGAGIESLDEMTLETCIISFFTDYAIAPQSSETSQLVMQSIKFNTLHNAVHTLSADIQKKKVFSSIDDLVNMCITILLEAIKSLAYFKNIVLKILDKKQ